MSSAAASSLISPETSALQQKFLLSATAFLSAFLLFQVQLIIAKYILPWWGGTPAVWATCLVFFQIVLLAGYAYAHGISLRWPTRYMQIHQMLLLAGLAIVIALAFVWPSPITPGANWKPPDPAHPAGRIVLLLAVSVGLPFFLLSATAPLTQLWLARTRPDGSPYWLYAVSNLGSLLGLVSYPFLVEPYTRLHTQSWIWSAAFAAFVFLCSASAAVARTHEERRAGGLPVASAATSVSPSTRALWFLLAAFASIMLLSTTNVITQEVAVIPLLWVLPLCIYLLTFILCFESERWYRPKLFHTLFVIACWHACYVLPRLIGVIPIKTQLVVFSAVLFVLCMVCNGEMVRLKPPPDRLTSFYLTISAGGAAGGVFVSLVAPLIFPSFWEYDIGLAGCGALLLWVLWRDRTSWLRAAGRWALAAGIVALLYEAGFLANLARKQFASSIYSSRNFYGEFLVNDNQDFGAQFRARTMFHAQVRHGVQLLDPAYRHIATTYYSKGSGVGAALLYHPRRLAADPQHQGLNIGVIGLGAGTLAAYGRPGDSIRFYEINPDVIRVAAGPKALFTYVADSEARVSIVSGDARLSLEQEAAAGDLQNFDVLAVDAFNSDSIPVHLLTREAFQLYLKHLRPAGLLAIHVSNHALDLTPVVMELAQDLHLESARFTSPRRGYVPDPASDDFVLPRLGHFIAGAQWIVLSRDPAFFREAEVIERADTDVNYSPVPMWTDDYSNLFRVLRKGQQQAESAPEPETLNPGTQIR